MKVAKTSKMLLRHQQGYQSHQDNQQHTKLGSQSERNISPQLDITPGGIDKRGLDGPWLASTQNPQHSTFHSHGSKNDDGNNDMDEEEEAQRRACTPGN